MEEPLGNNWAEEGIANIVQFRNEQWKTSTINMTSADTYHISSHSTHFEIDNEISYLLLEKVQKINVSVTHAQLVAKDNVSAPRREELLARKCCHCLFPSLSPDLSP
jgi:hypothetical protein